MNKEQAVKAAALLGIVLFLAMVWHFPSFTPIRISIGKEPFKIAVDDAAYIGDVLYDDEKSMAPTYSIYFAGFVGIDTFVVNRMYFPAGHSYEASLFVPLRVGASITVDTTVPVTIKVLEYSLEEMWIRFQVEID